MSGVMGRNLSQRILRTARSDLVGELLSESKGGVGELDCGISSL
jgi:hypothetical protein